MLRPLPPFSKGPIRLASAPPRGPRCSNIGGFYIEPHFLTSILLEIERMIIA